MRRRGRRVMWRYEASAEPTIDMSIIARANTSPSRACGYSFDCVYAVAGRFKTSIMGHSAGGRGRFH